MLIVLLWVCLGLVSLTLVFGHSMTMALRGSDNDLAGRQAEQAIEGAARYARFLLANLETAGQLPLTETYVEKQARVGEAYFWFLGRPTNELNLTEPVFGLIDEASKLNLNRASASMLEALPGMTGELAAAIVDWRDTNSDLTSGGAENETYLMRNPPYECKNAPFETVEELPLVNGATWTILYGEDANRNGVLDANENDGDLSPPTDDSDGVLDPGIVEYLTVYTPDDKVNVYTASETVLACIPGINAVKAAQLVAQRETADNSTTNLAWVAELLGPENARLAMPHLKARSYQASADIVAVGRQGRGYRRALFVIDFSGDTPQVVYRKDLDALGWALGTHIYEELAMLQETRR